MHATAVRVRRNLALFTAVFTFSLAANGWAQEVKSLRGKPSSDQILNALTPDTADSPTRPVRTRGLSLNREPAADSSTPSSAQQEAVQQVAAPAPLPRPQAQPQAQVQTAAQHRPQSRALDLEIKFQFNSDQLSSDGKDVLDQLAAALKSDKLATARAVTLEGHADAKGSATYNQALSLKRAQSSRNYLITRHGIPNAKIKATGKGSSELADPNRPEDEVNRRVRVIVDL